MSEQYTNQVLKVIVAQICQTIGWHSIQTTPLELMVDILKRYLEQISKQTYRYSELYNRTEANLDDLGLAYKDMNINLSDIEEYIQYVDPVPSALEIPKYPLPKESHLNFLKPGSKEVLTRPVHIYEYLPPIDPPSEDEELPVDKDEKPDANNVDVVNVTTDENGYFKRPGSVLEKPDAKKQRVMFEEESRPIREISSVMMTTSGFISPAREGKLPDTKAPVIIPEIKPQPVIPVPPPITPALPINSIDGKFSDKKLKKNKDKNSMEKEKKKDKIPKDVLKASKKLEKLVKLEKHEKMDKLEKLDKFEKFEKLDKNHFPNQNLIPTKQEIQFNTSNSIPPPSIPISMMPGSNLQNPINHNLPGSSIGNNLPLPFSPIQKPITNALPTPKKLGRPRKDKSLVTPPPMTPKKAAKLMAKLAASGTPPDLMFKQFLNPLNPASQNLAALGGLNKNVLLPNNFNPASYMQTHLPQSNIPSNFPTNLPSNFPVLPQQKPLMEEKISSEPDKQKLNIFKKISKVKDDNMFSKVVDPVKQEIKSEVKSTNDQVIVIDDDQNSNPMPIGPALTSNTTPMKREDHGSESFSKNSLPLNMSLHKTPGNKFSPGDANPMSFDMMNRTLTPKPGFDSNQPKPRKKYKTKKEKEKQKAMEYFNNVMLNNDIQMYPNFKNSGMFNESIKPQQQSPQMRLPLQPSTSSGMPHNVQNLFPMFPFPSGPGLIPSHNFMNNYNQNFGFPRPPLPDMNLFLPRFRKPDFSEENTKPTIPVEKPQCNVAPLVPDSLKIDIKPPTPQIVQSVDLASPISHSLTHDVSQKKYNEDGVGGKSQNLPTTPGPKIEEPIDVDEHKAPPTPTPMIHHFNQSTPLKETFIDLSKDAEMGDSLFMKDKREDKKHKKEKKDKEGKIKKKKDKKEKLKNKEKEKAEKRKEREDKKELKEKLKKEKREKKKEKERASALINNDVESISSTEYNEPSGSSKVMMKLGSSPRPDTPDSIRKIPSKQFKKEDRLDEMCTSPRMSFKSEREPSPELARISPLVTRPPKPPKPTSISKNSSQFLYTQNSNYNFKGNDNFHDIYEKNKISNIYDDDLSSHSDNLENLNCDSPRNYKNNIAPSPKYNVFESQTQFNNQQTKHLQTSIQHVESTSISLCPEQKQPTSIVNTNYISMAANNRASSYIDPEGNQVWICPACGRVDDGTPMIGCDGCDAWYHWVCVGIQVPPDVNEDWYCRVCIAKKQESHGSEKKKKRKKKDKKDH